MKISRLQPGKRAESDTGKINAQKVMTTIRILKFPVISLYGGARKLTFEDATTYHNTQELMVNGLWAVRGENAKLQMILKTHFS